MGKLGKLFDKYHEDKVERKSVFDGFVISPKDGRKGFNYRHEYFRYGVIFDVNPNYNGFNMAKQDAENIGLQGELVYNKKAYCAHYKPTSFEELATCLSYTKYSSFVKYLYGENTEMNFIKLIDAFARCNLSEMPDEQTISEYSSQIYSIIKEDKGPKFFAERMNMYEDRIIEAYNKINEFKSNYSGALPTQADYDFVSEEVPSEDEDVQTQTENISVEEIVKKMLANKENRYPSSESNVDSAGTSEEELLP